MFNHCAGMTARSRKTLKFCKKFMRFLGTTTPYGEICKILFRKFVLPYRSTLFCSNFVKFGREGIGKIVRYLPDKKNNKILPASQTVAR